MFKITKDKNWYFFDSHLAPFKNTDKQGWSANLDCMNDLPILEKIPFLTLGELHPVMEKIIVQFEEQNRVERFSFSNIDSLFARLQEQPFGFLFLFTKDNQTLVEQIGLLKTIKKLTTTLSVRVIVASQFKQPHYKMIYEKYGCHEYFEDPLPVKSIEFKIKKFVELTEKSIEAAKKIEEQLGFEYKSQGQKALMEWVESGRQTEKDIWIFEESKVRKSSLGWLIEARGPSPLLGHWHPCQDQPDLPVWIWTFEHSEFTSEQDAYYWVFYGEKPIFQTGMWNFKGAKPRLVLQELKTFNQESIQSALVLDVRFMPHKTEPKILIEKNSEASKNFFKKMIEALKNIPIEEIQKVQSTSTKEKQEAAEKKVRLKKRFDKIMASHTQESAESRVEKELKKIEALQTRKNQDQIQKIKRLTHENGLLGPIAFHYLIAELMIHPDYDFEKIIQQSSEYFDSSFPGAHISFYKELEGQWFCIPHKNRSLDGEWIGALSALKSSQKKEKVEHQGQLLFPIYRDAKEFVGVVSVQGDERIQQYSEDVLKNVCDSWLGVLFSAA